MMSSFETLVSSVPRMHGINRAIKGIPLLIIIRVSYNCWDNYFSI